MISLSRSRLAAWLLALLLTAAGCGVDCGAVGCLDGLGITLDASFNTGKTFDVVVSEVTTTPEVVPLVRCTYTFVPLMGSADAGSPMLSCSSVLAHSEQGNILLLPDWRPKRIDVKVSSEGATVAEKQFDVAFTTTEPNGKGCGTCTGSRVSVSQP